MNERQISCFLSVARHLSFSKASRELFISQPAISHHIQMLEKELDTRLFLRSTIAVELTPAGQVFLKEAEKLEQWYHSLTKIMQPYRLKQKIRLCIPPTMVLMDRDIYRELIRLLAEAIPGVQIETSLISDQSRSVADLINSDIDLLMINLNLEVLRTSSLNRKEMFLCDKKVMLSRHHRLADHPVLTLSDLENENIYAIQQDTCLIPNLLGELRKKNIRFHVSPINTYDMAVPLIELGQGISFIDQAYYQESGLIYIPLIGSEENRVGLVWNNGMESKVFARIAEALSPFYTKRRPVL